ncbi:HlyD family efflux transporter periplasmic adaptor subunit [Massilistercora timonensis]|uniref:HlyD family efflux transporter periplasmic adaptor subunit n=1 Tax=Massilistercora timonensis TaxID=2086584 RepID=UPI003AB898D6
MGEKKKLTNITVYRKKGNLNIGVFIFGIIFIYLIVSLLMYLTSGPVSVYEVRKGSILRDTAYTGFVVRDETIVEAQEEGYVNYFVTEGEKVGARTSVYASSPEKLDFQAADEESQASLTAEEEASLLTDIQAFSDNFQEANFQEVYTVKDKIEDLLDSRSSQNRKAQLDEMLKTQGDSLKVYNASRDGIIIYATDGYEDTTISDVTEEMITLNDHETLTLSNNTKVQAGDPVYKLITSDQWTVVVVLSDEMTEELAETQRIKVRFAKDNQTETADFAIYNTESANLGFLTFDTGMVRYARDRYLDIELILEDESGLKIPRSSVVEKEFYTVPEDYLTQGGNSQGNGVLVQTKDNARFQETEVFYRDTETGMIYLDPLDFSEDTVLIKPDSKETWPLNKTAKLKGVYNINKGYAVFKQIQILCESEEYYIVETGSDYGLSNYDHIALNGEDVKENDVVFQ